MSTPQDSVTLTSQDIDRARQLAEAMNADPEASRDGHPWTVQDVIGVALDRGLTAMKLDYGGRS